MKLYIAAHSQEEAKNVATVFVAFGHEITARWLSEDISLYKAMGDDKKPDIANRDFDDIDNSDALVLLACDEKVPGGKFVEAGIAIGLGKPVYLIGRRENALMWHHRVWQFKNETECCHWIESHIRYPNEI